MALTYFKFQVQVYFYIVTYYFLDIFDILQAKSLPCSNKNRYTNHSL